jgi:hypothetical protein
MLKRDLMDRIKQIESEYSVGTIEYGGIKIWPFIRSAIFLTYDFGESIVKENKPWNYLISKIGLIPRALKTTSLKMFFKKNSAILFTSDLRSTQRCVNGKAVDVFSALVTEHERDILPVIIRTRMTAIIPFSQYVNNDIFFLWKKLLTFIKRINEEKIVGKPILVNIVSDLQIEFNIDKYLLNLFSFISVFKLYFKIIKPKKIFLICYYGIEKMAASYVAKEMNIPVIELQHGVIHDAHPAYITKVNIKPNPYPDYLFCFGEGFKKFVSPFIYPPQNIFIIGNYYIDYIKKNKDKNRLLFLKKYNNMCSQIIITVAGLTELDNEMIAFIEKISEFRYDLCFIYIPRIMTSGFVHYSHKNIFIETELDVYQCMQNSHITSTVNSTCAIESLALGTPVILMNIQNLAKACYSGFFSPSDVVFYADTPEEYVSYIASTASKDRKQILSDAMYYYADDPKGLTQQTMKILNKVN